MPEGKIGINLTRHIYEKQMEHPEATGELTGILNQIAFAGKIVSREVNKAGLVEILGLTGDKNVQGEEVQKLDEFANDVFINILGKSGHFCVMATEEETDVIGKPSGSDASSGASSVPPSASLTPSNNWTPTCSASLRAIRRLARVSSAKSKAFRSTT